MSYTVKYNNVSLDTSKVDRKTIETLQISSDDQLFVPRASTLKFLFHTSSIDDLTFPYELNILEIYKDSEIYWCGYVHLTGITYTQQKNLYSIVCYDLLKILSEVVLTAMGLTGNYFGRPLSGVLEFVRNRVNGYLDQKAYQGFEITSSVSSEPSEIDIVYDITNGLDYAGTAYDLVTYSDRLMIGKLDDQFVFFREKIWDSGVFWYYFGIFQGTRAFYFSDAAGVRNEHKPAWDTSEFWIVKNDNEVTWYYKQSVQPDEHRLKGWRYGADGKVIASVDMLASTYNGTFPAHHLEYDENGDLEVVSGSWGISFNLTTASVASVAEYTANAGYFAYEGRLTPFMDFPYKYDEEVTLLRIMKDIAITFNGFYSLEKKQLSFITQNATIFQELNYADFVGKIDKKTKWIKDFEYELSETLKTEYADYIAYLEDFYNTNYGGKAKKISLKFRTETVINLLTFIDNNRVNNARRKIVAGDLFEYAVETIELTGGA